jgi:hypothetical protein
VQQQREPSPAYRVVWIVAALGAVFVLLMSLVVLVGVPRWFPGAADCTATVGDQSVELSTSEAERASSIGAKSVRLGVRPSTTVVAVADVLGASEGDGGVVAAALTGRAPHAFTCRHGGADEEEPDTLNRVGLTGRAAAVRRELTSAFGPQKLGGFAAGGVTHGHMPGSAHYEGRAVDVFFRPVTKKSRIKGWAMADYLVANAERLDIDTVIYDARIWTTRRSLQGWRRYHPDTSGRPAQVAAILQHRDHVHVDVAD